MYTTLRSVLLLFSLGFRLGQKPGLSNCKELSRRTRLFIVPSILYIYTYPFDNGAWNYNVPV